MKPVLILFMFSLLLLQNVNSQNSLSRKPGTDNFIQEIISSINRDSLAADIQFMVDLGTRFMYDTNRREVANKIAAKFRSFGMTDVILDSFKFPPETSSGDSVWQYNVVASLRGLSAPDEIYLIGAHHDDYLSGDPHASFVPGADDNASSCAIEMEIARVLCEKEYIPESTIRFVTFAAEENYGYFNYSGSSFYANKMAVNHEDIRLVISCDGTSYTTDSTNPVLGAAFPSGSGLWVNNLLTNSVSDYANLKLLPTEYPAPDGFPFLQHNYPVTGFQEAQLSPYYHSQNDVLNNCNMDFCLENAKACCAILLNEQLTPVPQIKDFSCGKSSISFHWKSTSNENVSELRVFRSTEDEIPSLVATLTRSDSEYTDNTVVGGILYKYYLASADSSGRQSSLSTVISAASAPHDKEILVIRDNQGGFNNPPDSSVMSFYKYLFSGYDVRIIDASLSDSVNISLLNQYRMIFWLSTAVSGTSALSDHIGEVVTASKSGGQFFISCFQPTMLISQNLSPSKEFLPEDTICKYFHILKLKRSGPALLNGAIPAIVDYPVLNIDPDKVPQAYNGHLSFCEVIYPSSGASQIYLYNSAYDSTTARGELKGLPVGIQYSGNDFRHIILSVPLYYVDTADAKNLISTVIQNKFTIYNNIPENDMRSEGVKIRCIPNPAGDQVRVIYCNPYASDVEIEIRNSEGKIIYRRTIAASPGEHNEIISIKNYPQGLYFILINSGNATGIEKFIHL